MVGGYAGYIHIYLQPVFRGCRVAGGSLFFVLVVGVVMERVIIRHFYNRPHEDQILVTFGLGICFVELVRYFFGSLSKTVPSPPWTIGITPWVLCSIQPIGWWWSA